MSSLRENCSIKAGAIDLPPELVDLLAGLPVRTDRRTLADVITRHLFPMSHRTLEAWPLPTQLVNGKAIVQTEIALKIAFVRLNSAPVIVGGRRSINTPGS